MLWFLLALLAAFLDATYYALIKHQLKTAEPNILIGLIHLGTCAVILPISILHGLPALDFGFFILLAAILLLDILGTFLYLYALRKGEISLVMPLLSFTPIFLVLVALFVLNEWPSATGAFGIFCIGLGSYVLYSNSGKNPGQGILDPLRRFWHYQPGIAMLLAALLASFSLVLTKSLILQSDPFFTAFIINLGLGIFFAVLGFLGVWGRACVKAFAVAPAPARSPVAAIPALPFKAIGVIVLVASLGSLAINNALVLQQTSYVMAIQRTTVFFGVLYGAILFREPDSGYRLPGALLMVLGAAALAMAQ